MLHGQYRESCCVPKLAGLPKEDQGDMTRSRVQSGREHGNEPASASTRYGYAGLVQQSAQAGKPGRATASGDEQEPEVS